MAAKAAPLRVAGLLLLSVAAVTGVQHICYEKISDIPAIFLQEHPAGNVLAVASQDGYIKLMVRPLVQTGTWVQPYSTYLDLSGKVNFEGQQGLLGFAFHPKFAQNGRFFVSYICDATKFPECQGPCACSEENGCASTPKAPQACPLNTIVAEFSAGTNPLDAITLNATEVRHVLRFGRPGLRNNGGHIWFGTDGLLYYASGDGGMTVSPAQDGRVPLGKILRIDVDINATGDASSLYGTYGVPASNPFLNSSGFMPEVYALGFRNPWRCSHDFVTKATLCGDIGPGVTQEVDNLASGANYGWPIFGGSGGTPVVAKAPVATTFVSPNFEYDGQAVIGGYVYRAARNPCLQGKYVFGDGDGATLVATLSATDATLENTTSSIAFDSRHANVSADGLVLSKPFPTDEVIFSWAVDASHELYRLSATGIYRVIDADICGGTCPGKLQVYGESPTDPVVTQPAKGSVASFILSQGLAALVAWACLVLLRL